MDLLGITAGAIGRVNPSIRATIKQAAGYTVAADGSQVPAYTTAEAWIQVQALSNDELQQVEGLNLQGNKAAVYLQGSWNGVVRAGRQGGDLLLFEEQTWLVAVVLENWPDWTKLAVVLQNGG